MEALHRAGGPRPSGAAGRYLHARKISAGRSAHARSVAAATGGTAAGPVRGADPPHADPAHRQPHPDRTRRRSAPARQPGRGRGLRGLSAGGSPARAGALRRGGRQAHRHRGAVVWLGLHEPDRATMRSIADAFDLHELTLEQALVGGHRPAVESIGDVTRLVLRTARYVEHEELTATSEVVDTGD